MDFHQKGRDGSKRGSILIQSVTAVVLQNQKRDIGSTLVWVVLAGLVALGIYLLIDANFIRVPGIGLMAAMATYLIYDHLTQPSGRLISIKTGEELLNIPISNGVALSDFSRLQVKLISEKDKCESVEKSTKVFALR